MHPHPCKLRKPKLSERSNTLRFRLCFTRRRAIQTLIGVSDLNSGPAFPQPLSRPPTGAPVAMATVVDISCNLQDVGRDLSSGSQSAWQSINATGGLQGRPVRHLTFTTDGSAQSIHEAWQRIEATDNCVVLSGCVGDAATRALVGLQTRSGTGASLAQMVPWVQADKSHPPGGNVFGIFPGYQEQIAHALQSLCEVGVREMDVVFANAGLRMRALPDVSQAAKDLRLVLRPLPLPGQPVSAAELLAEQR